MGEARTRTPEPKPNRNPALTTPTHSALNPGMPRLHPSPRKLRRILYCLLATLIPKTMAPALAADPQPYTVTLPPTGEALLDTALHDSSNLIALRENAPAGPFALVIRAREDAARLQSALGSFGHYDAKIAISIVGKDVDDPTLPDTLEAAKTQVEVAIAITAGPTYKLGKITLTGPAIPPEARAALALTPGDPARAADVLAAQGRLLDSLRNTGHALAKVDTPAATLVPASKTLDVSYHVEAGPRVDLGPIAVDGLDRVDPAYVRRRLTIHQADPFDPTKIEEARQDLASLGVFATVRTRAATALDPQGQLPIDIDVTERPRHVIGANLAYSTDLGATAGVTFQHRNLFGSAEQLNLGAAIANVGGSASRGAGYNVTAALTKPDIFVRNQSVTVSLQGIKENLDAYDRTAALAGIQFNRKVTPALTATAGLQAQQSLLIQEGVTRNYTLLGVPIGLKYDTTGPEGLFEPTHGIKANLLATPTESFKGNAFFTIVQFTGSTYVNLAAPGRSVVALRATVGTIQGATTFQVPPDQRFYAGGSGTVRGYRYQSVGPHFADNRPTGGSSLAAATLEFRQRFGESFGAAAFLDAGQVGASTSPFGGQTRAGAGIGARYYTPIGPIRLDVAVPLNKQRNDDSFELYIGIGQVF